MKRANPHTQLVRACLDALAARFPPEQAWFAQSNTGARTITDDNGKKRFLQWGLGTGGADIVGCVSAEIESEADDEHLCSCGNEIICCNTTWETVGRFCALECKTGKATLSAAQRKWRDRVQQCGGFFAVVRHPDEAIAAVERCMRGESK
jgi:hypothetical protein